MKRLALITMLMSLAACKSISHSTAKDDDPFAPRPSSRPTAPQDALVECKNDLYTITFFGDRGAEPSTARRAQVDQMVVDASQNLSLMECGDNFHTYSSVPVLEGRLLTTCAETYRQPGHDSWGLKLVLAEDKVMYAALEEVVGIAPNDAPITQEIMRLTCEVLSPR